MPHFSTLVSLIVLAMSLGSDAAIGPVTDLDIANAAISPDGFSRQAVLAGGTFPGPVITGNKVDPVLRNCNTWISLTFFSRVITSRLTLSINSPMPTSSRPQPLYAYLHNLVLIGFLTEALALAWFLPSWQQLG